MQSEFLLSIARHHNVTNMANKPIWIHLSSQILSSQFSFGNAEPGKVNNMIEIINQAMAGIKEGFMLLNEKNFDGINNADLELPEHTFF